MARRKAFPLRIDPDDATIPRLETLEQDLLRGLRQALPRQFDAGRDHASHAVADELLSHSRAGDGAGA